MKFLPAPLLIGLAGISLFAIGRCSAPTPSGPSRDSLALADYALQLDAERQASAKRDSARNATIDSLIADATRMRVTVRQRLTAARSGPVPPDTAIAALDYWKGRSAAAETLLDLTVTADSATMAGMAAQFAGQQAEAAHLRDLLAGAQDSISKAAVTIGRLEQRVAGKGCHKVLGVPLPEPGIGYGVVAPVTGGVTHGLVLSASVRLACIL